MGTQQSREGDAVNFRFRFQMVRVVEPMALWGCSHCVGSPRKRAGAKAQPFREWAGGGGAGGPGSLVELRRAASTNACKSSSR